MIWNLTDPGQANHSLYMVIYTWHLYIRISIQLAVDGDWGNWGVFTKCTVTCGTGTMSRMRHCNEPTPSTYGKHCVGSNNEAQTCTREICPGNG